ncbi:hypothetical protein LOTGIDRAFT_168227 [Lottia gigantea]|uniref:Transmembrane protein 135 N-terminal domain-containing protein n=1 Tax=Lottia gigantea TaxID=225164 RepID=V4B8C3_LOTGI|nr:hypothetical protein LOTGIDRAFT_168227 [Lottia gigantea]ESO84969.1 hypothetical protein LOTGIDRAFT_168227 [Lottia gigantea]
MSMSKEEKDATGDYVRKLNTLALCQRFVTDFFRGFSSGAILYAGVKGVSAFMKNPFRKGLPALGKEIVCTDAVKFSAFLGLYPSIYHLVVDILQIARSTKDGWNHGIAGGIAGLSIIVEDETRRKVASLFAIARALGAGLTTLVKRGKITRIPYCETWSFCACCAFLVYCTALKPELLSKGYYKSILKWSRDYSDENLTLLFRKPAVEFINCQSAGLHKQSCTHHAVKDFCYSYPAFAKLYLPIHATPMVLFRRKQLYQKPLQELLTLARNLAMSSAFLSTMVMLAKYGLCVMRNAYGRPPPIPTLVPVVAGFVCGMGILFERARRRKELALFLIPHTLYAIYLMLKKSKLTANLEIPHGFVILFSLSMGNIMHAYEREPHSLTQLIRGLLNFFVGKHKV